MRILFVVPHYFGPPALAQEPLKTRGSAGGNAKKRADSVGRTLERLQTAFGRGHNIHDFVGQDVLPANRREEAVVGVVVCTSGDHHLVSRLRRRNLDFTHVATREKPSQLGFACLDVLRKNLGAYDYYCYLEDDILVHDPYFFWKVSWFTTRFGCDRVLLPYRYETFPGTRRGKLYLDATVPRVWTRAHHDFSRDEILETEYLGRAIRFRPATNPHAGCFFLNAAQFERWATQPTYSDRDSSFIGPMESAASLGVLKTFTPYKPDYAFCDFLEVEHADSRYIQTVGPLLD